MNTTPIWREKLHERRINDTIIDEMQIQPHAGGWIYPTPNGGTRWKAFDSQAPVKYRWYPSKPNGENYYHAQDLVQAIQASRGELWLVTEADLWAMLSAGIRNALALYGEGMIPDEFPLFLENIGVRHLLFVPDYDDVGQRYAQRLATALINTSITFTAYQIPKRLRHRADIGKLWLTFQGGSFEEALKSLPQLEVEPETRTPARPSEYRPSDQSFLEELDSEIVTRLSEKGATSRQEWYGPVRCPFHNDRGRPNAYWNTDKHILHCFVCDQTFLAVETAHALGIEITHRRGLPIEVLEGIMGQKCHNAARLLYVLCNVLDWQPGRVFTCPEAMEATKSLGLSKNMIYRAVDETFFDQPIFSQLAVIRTRKNHFYHIKGIIRNDSMKYSFMGNRTKNRKPYDSVSNAAGSVPGSCIQGYKEDPLHRDFCIEDSTRDFCILDSITEQKYMLESLYPTTIPYTTSTRLTPRIWEKVRTEGRDARLFVIPDPVELARLMGRDTWYQHYVEVPLEAVSSAKAFRQALHVDFIKRRGMARPYSRQELGNRLGLSGNTIYMYDKECGVVAEPQVAKQEKTAVDLSDYPEKPLNNGTWLQSVDGKHFPACKTGLMAALERSFALVKQATVYEYKRLANKYHMGDTVRDAPTGPPCSVCVWDLSTILT